GGCLGPSKFGVSTNGSFNIETRLRSLAAAAKVALMLAKVPPENVPFIARTRPVTPLAGAPRTRFAVCWQKYTPSSKGSESKPQENTILAPEDFAAASCAVIIRRIHGRSPRRSREAVDLRA